MFAIGSIYFYQEAFLIPGIIPSLANSRKQIRQSPKSRIKARLREHLKQRFVARVLNLGFFCDRAVTEVFAIQVCWRKERMLPSKIDSYLMEADTSLEYHVILFKI